jgi:biotin synthase
MFEELGLNVSRQPDNAANPRPDNRSGWLEGETPHPAAELPEGASPPREVELAVSLWDPSTQLRYRPKRRVPRRPDGAPNTARAA